MIWIIVLAALALCAFPPSLRKYIFWRDDGTCQDCGKRWSDGWMLHASHNDHCLNGCGGAKLYNDPANGKLRCIKCHIIQHQQLMRDAKSNKEKTAHAQAIRKLKKCDKRNYNYYKSKP